MANARFWALSWFLSAAVWMLLVDNLSAAEVFPGAGVAAIAATGATLVRAQRGPAAWPRPRWLARLWRPLLAAPRDLIVVLAAVLRSLFAPGRPCGATRTLPFSAVGHEPESQVRRALTQAAGSFAPNTIVLGIDRERGELIVHQLRPTQNLETAADPLHLR